MTKKFFLAHIIFWSALCLIIVSIIYLVPIIVRSSSTISEITNEAIKSNNDPLGRPLPLMGHWNVYGFVPDDQRVKIESKSNHLLMWFSIPSAAPAAPTRPLSYYESSIKWSAANNLPISFVGTQWEQILYGVVAGFPPQPNPCDPYPYYCLPPDQNPNVIDLNGSILKKVDPMGPIAAWRDAGVRWGSSDTLKQLQSWYPNPPLAVFVSNDEAQRLEWPDLEQSRRFVNTYGTGTNDALRQVGCRQRLYRPLSGLN